MEERPSPVLTGLFLNVAGDRYERAGNEVLTGRAEAFMKSLAPEGRVFAFACDEDERITRHWETFRRINRLESEVGKGTGRATPGAF